MKILLTILLFLSLPVFPQNRIIYRKETPAIYNQHRYATWNPNDAGAGITFSGGNLIIFSGVASPTMVRSTIGVNSASLYFNPHWEITIIITASTGESIGIALPTAPLNQYVGENTSGYGLFNLAAGGGYLYNGGLVGSGYLSYTSGDVLGYSLNTFLGTLTVQKNGVTMGSGITGLTGTFYAAASIGTISASAEFIANFGQSPFTYPVPAGYLPGLYN